MDERVAALESLDVTQSWTGRRVLVTGHTGFKGAWLSHWLLSRGAKVFGLSLPPDGSPCLFDELELAQRMDHLVCDVRNATGVKGYVSKADPDVVFHLAAQSLVRRSYRDPLFTLDTNVMGTANVLEALRERTKPTAAVIITTDKVYENLEQNTSYIEDDKLGGHDIYSASKAAAEIATASYRASFFAGTPVRIATARAGNVIGGGDWAEDRILPDLARAFGRGQTLIVRNPRSIRPWQHVLEPLKGYMDLAEGLLAGRGELEAAFNFGPNASDQRPVEDLVSTSLKVWPGEVKYQSEANAPHEASRLSLSIDKANSVLGWSPRWRFEQAVSRTVDWYRRHDQGANARDLVNNDIAAFDESER